MSRALRLFVVGLGFSCILTAAAAARAQRQFRSNRLSTGFRPLGTALDQDGSFWIRLLGSKKTQQELKLSDEVVAKLVELGDRESKKYFDLSSGDERQTLMQLNGPARQAGESKFRKKLDASSDEMREAIKTQLSSTQIERLEQIALQIWGPQALDDTPWQDRLQLTPSQREQIKAARAEAIKKRNELFQSGEWQGLREKLTTLQKETDRRLLAILTEKQAQDFEALKGPKIDGAPSEWLGGYARSGTRAQSPSGQSPSGQSPTGQPPASQPPAAQPAAGPVAGTDSGVRHFRASRLPRAAESPDADSAKASGSGAGTGPAPAVAPQPAAPTSSANAPGTLQVNGHVELSSVRSRNRRRF